MGAGQVLHLCPLAEHARFLLAASPNLPQPEGWPDAAHVYLAEPDWPPTRLLLGENQEGPHV